jgi:hypothetical protein
MFLSHNSNHLHVFVPNQARVEQKKQQMSHGFDFAAYGKLCSNRLVCWVFEDWFLVWDTVDGCEILRQLMVNIPLFIGFQPSKVAWDFFHPQYVEIFWVWWSQITSRFFYGGWNHQENNQRDCFFPNLIVGPVQKAFVHCGMNLLVSMWMNQSMEFSTVLTSPNIFDTHHMV